jgi:hypothetical protein
MRFVEQRGVNVEDLLKNIEMFLMRYGDPDYPDEYKNVQKETESMRISFTITPSIVRGSN